MYAVKNSSSGPAGTTHWAETKRTETKRRVLVTGSERDFAQGICAVLGLAGIEACPVASLGEAMSVLRRDAHDIAVVGALDGVEDGAAATRALRSIRAELPVIVVGEKNDLAGIRRVFHAGAADYLSADMIAELPVCVEKHALSRLPFIEEGVVANDPASAKIFRMAQRVARSDTTVLIAGESGSGKEVVARYIHRCSRRAGGPFIAINCAAIPDTLLEAALFGHERGAYTGAVRSRTGKFEQARGGTIFLDEIGDMPLALQTKLLRVLQEREVERVGGDKSVAIDVRVIAASNRDLAGALADGNFREDLFYRLSVFPIEIAPLRERRGDILPLALASIARHAGTDRGARLSPEARVLLEAHDWPGNARELDNIVQRALVLADGDSIRPEHIAFDRRTKIRSPVADVSVANRASDIESLERDHIMATLASVKGSRKLAVERLGISERTLRNKLRRYSQAMND